MVERPSEVLHTTPSEFLRALFGIELSNDDILPFDENLLTSNPVPTVWLASDVSSLPEDTVARFVFHAPLKKADRTEQERALRTQLAELKPRRGGCCGNSQAGWRLERPAAVRRSGRQPCASDHRS